MLSMILCYSVSDHPQRHEWFNGKTLACHARVRFPVDQWGYAPHMKSCYGCFCSFACFWRQLLFLDLLLTLVWKWYKNSSSPNTPTFWHTAQSIMDGYKTSTVCTLTQARCRCMNSYPPMITLDTRIHIFAETQVDYSVEGLPPLSLELSISSVEPNPVDGVIFLAESRDGWLYKQNVMSGGMTTPLCHQILSPCSACVMSDSSFYPQVSSGVWWHSTVR